jgi:hypothetical protein
MRCLSQDKLSVHLLKVDKCAGVILTDNGKQAGIGPMRNIQSLLFYPHFFPDIYLFLPTIAMLRTNRRQNRICHRGI